MLLLKPIRIGPFELRNRIVMPAMHLGYSPLGRVTDQLVAFYRERARGGVGLIVVGGCVINAEAGGPMFLSLRSDDDVPAMARLASAIKGEGARASAQLYHGGRYVHAMFLDGGKALGPSPVYSPFTKETPREATLDDIERTLADFAAAAGRARRAGFDAVEVLGSAGYLISQFLSPVTNKRTDRYGGTLEGRMRFGLEAIEAVRRAVGPDSIVGLRLAGNEFVEGGGGSDLAVAFAAEASARGLDYVSVTGGWHETHVPQILGEVPEGAFTYLARKVRQVSRAPVFVANRLGSPEVAEKTLRDGLADAICMGRPLIADPDLPRKLGEGRVREIVRCAACNQGCFDGVMRLRPTSCMVNPRVGAEAAARPSRAGRPKRVVVVGGGPAGMMAALTAAQRGHTVSLHERRDHLGGQLDLAAAVPGKAGLAVIAADLEVAVRQAGVEVCLGAELDADAVLALGPDAVVVATGAAPAPLELPGSGTIPVVQAWDVLAGREVVGKRAVVIGGGATGVETALHLARSGAMDAPTAAFLLVHGAEPPELIREMAIRGPRTVTLIEIERKVATEIGPSTRWSVMAWLERCGVEVLTSTEAVRLERDGLVVRKSGSERLVPADGVVLALGSRPNAGITAALEGRVPELLVVGDARQVSRALDAIHEGYATACAL